MENALRMTIIFVWSMFFGFFSVIGYLDETMTAQRKAVILLGLLGALAAYLAFEWFTSSRELEKIEEDQIDEKVEEITIKEQPPSQLDERVLRRLQLYTKDNEKELQAALKQEPSRKRKKPALSTPKR